MPLLWAAIGFRTQRQSRVHQEFVSYVHRIAPGILIPQWIPLHVNILRHLSILGRLLKYLLFGSQFTTYSNLAMLVGRWQHTSEPYSHLLPRFHVSNKQMAYSLTALFTKVKVRNSTSASRRRAFYWYDVSPTGKTTHITLAEQFHNCVLRTKLN